MTASNSGRGKNNRNGCGKNRMNRGKKNSNKNTPWTTSNNRGMPTSSVLCDSDASLSYIQRASASVTDFLSKSSEMFKRVLGSGPSVICKIPQSLGHNAVVCSLLYQPHSSTALPAMASETLWYPNSTVASHMTLDEAMLFAQIPYSGFVQVEVGESSLLLIANIANLSIQTRSRLLKLNFVLHVPQLKHNLFFVRRLCHVNGCHV